MTKSLQGFTPAECLALEYADRLATDHHNMDDAFFDRLKEHYSDGQVLELGMMIGQFIGFGRLLAVLDLESNFASRRIWLRIFSYGECSVPRPCVASVGALGNSGRHAGYGYPIPTPERAGPATAIVVDGKAYLWILAPVSYGTQLRFLPNMGGRWRL